MRVLVLGAYGLIGAHVVRALLAANHAVTGLGRDMALAKRRLPRLPWHNVDIVNMRRPEQWRVHLENMDAVVNCAGALQEGARDHVVAVQSQAMRALFEACAAAGVRVVQISAVGVSPQAATRFMRTKAEADAFLAAGDLDWTILRPGLVIAPSAYGATALLRALAAFPFVIPVLGGRQKVQTIHAGDLAAAVVAAIEGRVPDRKTYDLVEAQAHTLDALLVAMRAWLGFAPAPVLHVPAWLAMPILKLGDGLRWLGWRTPACSTAFIEINAGVTGDPSAWRAATGAAPTTPFARTLERIPSTVQERWFARSWLLKPVVIATLALFWILSGAIALARLDVAAALLASHGMSPFAAEAIATAGAALDIVLGSALLVQRFCAWAARAMIGLSLVYLGGATALMPALWADPLGPLLKAVPAIVLAVVVLAQMEER